jgi:hypothetical protein
METSYGMARGSIVENYRLVSASAHLMARMYQAPLLMTLCLKMKNKVLLKLELNLAKEAEKVGGKCETSFVTLIGFAFS